MKIHVPPIKCQGIKTKLVPWILHHTAASSAGRWIEPFMGSGVVGFNVRPQRAVFADLNPHIINFYNAIKTGSLTSATAKSFLEHEGNLLTQNGQAYYYTVRERFNNQGDPLDFLFLSRSCFNGVIRFNQKGRYNVPFGHKPNRFAQAYITKITNQIKYVESALQHYDWDFICADFRTVLSQVASHDFLYCDPPYIGRHTDYYSSWSDSDEEELFDGLASTHAKFMLSTWHSNRYRQNALLAKHATTFIIVTKEHFYHVGASEKNRHAMREALVLNYPPDRRSQATGEDSSEVTQVYLMERNAEYE